jgi:hypothetical protein
MVADYKALYEEAIVDAGGDIEAAKKAASERFSRSYGVSDFSTMGTNVVVKNPPEKAYPAAPDGTYDYIRDQLNEALKGEGVAANEVYLQPDDMTAQDIRSGKPPRYTVFYEQDGKIQRYHLPFYVDVDVMQQQFKAKKDEMLRNSEQRMMENRREEERRFPEGRGEGNLERFGNDQTYRGIAREGSPLGRAIEQRRNERNKAIERGRAGRAADDAERKTFEELSPEEQRARSLDDFLGGPFQPRGNR